VTFLDARGKLMICGLGGGALAEIGRADLSGLDPRLADVAIHIACDVKNPLTGINGAAAVFGPQKGATPEMIDQLDQGLSHWANLLREQLGKDVEFVPGAGAAGGLGAGLLALCGGKLESGVTIVAQTVGLKRRLAGADLVITGEGRLDHSSRFGKTAVGVAELARAASAPTVCIPGQATDDAPRDLFAAVHPLTDVQTPPRTAMLRAADLLTQRAATAMREFLTRNQNR
jgi:glycerate kinase